MLEEKGVDKRVKLYKAISGLIPGGSFAVELMVNHIPNQRMDRLFKFIEEMNARLEKLESKEFLKSNEYAFLAESSIIESTRPHSEKYITWLVSIAMPSFAPSTMELEYRKKAVDILSDLSDHDVECLLEHTEWQKKIKYERKMIQNISITLADKEKLSDHDLFVKRLTNQRLYIYRNSLIEKGLIERESQDYNITKAGKLFVYVITGEYPRN